MKTTIKIIIWGLLVFSLSCSPISKPIDGAYIEKGGSRTLVFKTDGTFQESPPVSNDPTAQGYYELIGNKIATSYKYKDGGGPVDFDRGKRLDDDTLHWDGKTFVRQSSSPTSSVKSVAGSYTFMSSDIPRLNSALTLKDDGSFRMTIHLGDDEEMLGSYKVTGDTISFYNIHGTSSSRIEMAAKIEGQRIKITGKEKGNTFEIVYERDNR